MTAPRRVAVMEPYLFPYLGYWQLMASADVFLLYDDVQYVRRSWINRNRVLVSGKPSWLTVPVASAPLETPIIGMRLGNDYSQKVRRVHARIAHGYRDAPALATGLTVVERSLRPASTQLIEVLLDSLAAIRAHLDISAPLLRSSTLDYDRTSPRQERLIELCRMLGAEEYLSLSGGRGLYDPETFATAGITLRFHDLDGMVQRADPECDARFSILDSLMTTSRERLHALVHGGRWLA